VDSNKGTVFWRLQRYVGEDGERLAYKELLIYLTRWMQQSLDDGMLQDEMAGGQWKRPRREDDDDDGEDDDTPPSARPVMTAGRSSCGCG